jgi:hypothetical protein
MPQATESMLLKWYDARSGAAPLERRLWRMLSVVHAMTSEEVTTLDDEIERLCKDFEEAAEAMRQIVKTHRQVEALKIASGRKPEEAEVYRQGAKAVVIARYGDDASRWPASLQEDDVLTDRDGGTA